MHKRESKLCPGCGHAMLVVVNDSREIVKQNEIRFKEYELSMLEWRSAGSDPKKEPKQPKGSQEEMLVCMCCVTACTDKYSGKGCVVCEEFVQNSPDRMVLWDPQTAMCTCGPCRCKCSVYFPRSIWQEVAFAAEMEKEKKALHNAAKVAETKTKQSSKLILLLVFKKRWQQTHLSLFLS